MPAGSPWRMCPSRCPRPPRPPTSATSSTSCWPQRTVGPAAGAAARERGVPRAARPGPAPRGLSQPGGARGAPSRSCPAALAWLPAVRAPGIDLKRCGTGAAGHSQRDGPKAGMMCVPGPTGQAAAADGNGSVAPNLAQELMKPEVSFLLQPLKKPQLFLRC